MENKDTVLETGKNKGMDSPLESLEGMQPCECLGLSPVRPIWAADLQNYKIINLCYTKAVSLW